MPMAITVVVMMAIRIRIGWIVVALEDFGIGRRRGKGMIAFQLQFVVAMIRVRRWWWRLLLLLWLMMEAARVVEQSIVKGIFLAITITVCKERGKY